MISLVSPYLLPLSLCICQYTPISPKYNSGPEKDILLTYPLFTRIIYKNRWIIY